MSLRELLFEPLPLVRELMLTSEGYLRAGVRRFLQIVVIAGSVSGALALGLNLLVLGFPWHGWWVWGIYGGLLATLALIVWTAPSPAVECEVTVIDPVCARSLLPRVAGVAWRMARGVLFICLSILEGAMKALTGNKRRRHSEDGYGGAWEGDHYTNTELGNEYYDPLKDDRFSQK